MALGESMKLAFYLAVPVLGGDNASIMLKCARSTPGWKETLPDCLPWLDHLVRMPGQSHLLQAWLRCLGLMRTTSVEVNKWLGKEGLGNQKNVHCVWGYLECRVVTTSIKRKATVFQLNAVPIQCSAFNNFRHADSIFPHHTSWTIFRWVQSEIR